MKLVIDIDGYIDRAEGFNLATLKNIVNANPDATEIQLNVNSEGGDLYEGWAIHDYLTELQKTKNVTAKVNGIVASIATIIVGALEADKVRSTKNSNGYIHNPIYAPNEAKPMEAKDLFSLGDMLKDEQDKIFAFYKKRLKAGADEIKQLMEGTVKLTAEKMLEIGLIGSIENSLTGFVRNELPIKTQINIDTMTKQFTPEQTSWLEKRFDAMTENIKALFKKDIKAMLVKLEDGNEIYVKTEDEDLMGKEVVTAENGQPTETPAADGTHTTADGRVIVVSGGIVTEVKEAEDVDAKLQAATAEVEKLKAELVAATAKAETVVNEKEVEFQNKFNELKGEFEAFKNKIVTGEIENEQDFPKNNGSVKKDIYTEALAKRKEAKK